MIVAVVRGVVNRGSFVQVRCLHLLNLWCSTQAADHLCLNETTAVDCEDCPYYRSGGNCSSGK
ncbi:MAG: hypothetical protein ACLU6Y_00430 [Ruminococcus sp.]